MAGLGLGEVKSPPYKKPCRIWNIQSKSVYLQLQSRQNIMFADTNSRSHDYAAVNVLPFSDGNSVGLHGRCTYGHKDEPMPNNYGGCAAGKG